MADGEPRDTETQQDRNGGETPRQSREVVSGSGATMMTELPRQGRGILEQGQKQQQLERRPQVLSRTDSMQQSGLVASSELPYCLPSDVCHLGGDDASPLWEGHGELASNSIA